MPAAIAPDDTITTSEPAFIRPSIASASTASLPASNTPDGVVSAVVPTLTTTLRAVRMASRCRLITPRLLALAAPLTTGGLALGGPDPVRLLEPRIGAAAGQQHVDAGRCLRLPVEGHVADGHRAAGLGAEAQQFVFDTETGQPVAEVADGLVVVEIGLV